MSIIIFVYPYKHVHFRKIGLWTVKVRVWVFILFPSESVWPAVRKKEQTRFPHLKGKCTKTGKYLLKMAVRHEFCCPCEVFDSEKSYLVGRKRWKDAVCRQTTLLALSETRFQRMRCSFGPLGDLMGAQHRNCFPVESSWVLFCFVS